MSSIASHLRPWAKFQGCRVIPILFYLNFEFYTKRFTDNLILYGIIMVPDFGIWERSIQKILIFCWKIFFFSIKFRKSILFYLSILLKIVCWLQICFSFNILENIDNGSLNSEKKIIFSTCIVTVLIGLGSGLSN